MYIRTVAYGRFTRKRTLVPLLANAHCTTVHFATHMKPKITMSDPVLDHLRDRLQPYLTERLGAPVSITSITRLIGGACQDNYGLDLQIDDSAPAAYVLRTDKGKALSGSLSRAVEYKVVEAAHRARVRTPAPFLLEESPDVIGHPFYIM